MIKMCYVALMGTSTEVFIGHVFWWKKKDLLKIVWYCEFNSPLG